MLGQPAQPLPPEPRPATPTAVFATAPAPEAANDSAITASARRSSAEGSVADDALSAASSAAAKPRGPLPLGLRRLTCFGNQRTRAQTSLGQFRNSPYGTRQSRSPLVGRKSRPPLATRLPSSLLKTSHFFGKEIKNQRCLRGQVHTTSSSAIQPAELFILCVA